MHSYHIFAIVGTILLVGICVFIAIKYKSEKNIFVSLADIFVPSAISLFSVVFFLSSLDAQRQSLEIQSKEFSRNNYNDNFSLVFNEVKHFIENLDVTIKYNNQGKEPVELTGLDVIDELAYYLKRGDVARTVISKDEFLQNKNIINDKNAWFVAPMGSVYFENNKYYKVVERPEKEKDYFEKINLKFRNIITPMFDLLADKNNQNLEIHKRIFAAYLNKNVFEAYLTTREKPQNWPETELLRELIELCAR